MRFELLALASVLFSFERSTAFLPTQWRVTSSVPSVITSLRIPFSPLYMAKKENQIPGLILDDPNAEYCEQLGMYLPTITGTRIPRIMIGLGPFDCYDLTTPLDEMDIKQNMSKEEREENLRTIRKVKNVDLRELKAREDDAGFMEAQRDIYERMSADPWFMLNNRMCRCYDLAMAEEPEGLKEIEKIREYLKAIGGPPSDDIKMWQGREYASTGSIDNKPMSYSQAQQIIGLGRLADSWAVNRQRKEQLKKRKKAKEPKHDNTEKELEDIKARNYVWSKYYMNEEEKRRKEAEKEAKEILKKYGVESDDWKVQGNMGLNKAILQATKQGGIKKSKLLKKKKMSEKREARNDGGRPRAPGDDDMTMAEIDENTTIAETSTTEVNNVRVVVTSEYNAAQSDPLMRKHCFGYTIQITNLSETDKIKLVSRKFEIQTVGASEKDIVSGQGVTGRQPILKPGESFEYSSTAPLNVRPLGTTIVAARMKGEYAFVMVEDENEDIAGKETLTAELGTFHFIFPPDQRVIPVRATDDDEDDDEDDEMDVPPEAKAVAAPQKQVSTTSPSMPGDSDMKEGVLTCKINDESDCISDNVRVQVTSQYRPERSDEKLDKHCFAYNIRITNENEDTSVQLISRRFEIQTVMSDKKDVVQGPGVTGRQPILKPGESFEYTSTAPLSVKPVNSTPVVARMQGEYSFVTLGGKDGTSPLSSTPLKAVLERFHFVLPAYGLA